MAKDKRNFSETKANKKSQINTIVVINTKIKVREELISTINQELAQINSAIKKNVTEVNALKASKQMKAFGEFVLQTVRDYPKGFLILAGVLIAVAAVL